MCARLAFLHGKRGPQAREPAADDADVRVDVAVERVADIIPERCRRFFEPPGRLGTRPNGHSTNVSRYRLKKVVSGNVASKLFCSQR